MKLGYSHKELALRSIDVDFDVYKALTMRRPSEGVTENDVLRELLGLPSRKEPTSAAGAPAPGDWITKGVRFPAGTEFRVTYKGKTYLARVEGGALVLDGKRHDSPSSAAVAITGNNVNLSRCGEADDLVVFATGYGDMNQWAAQLISPEVAQNVGRVWGLGSATKYDPGPWEGELRNMWKPTRQEGLWFHGGNLMQSRHYSLYLAMQMKARQAQLAVPV